MLLPRRPVQLNQGQLDFLMAASVDLSTGAKRGANVIGEPAGHVEQLALARRLMIGDRRFEEMAGAVQLMAVLDILPAIVRLDEREIGVEVAVRLLGGGDLVDDGVGAFFQAGVALAAQSVSDAFEDFVEVGIVVQCPFVLARRQLAGDREVLDPPGNLALMEIRLDGGGAVGLDARRVH